MCLHFKHHFLMTLVTLMLLSTKWTKSLYSVKQLQIIKYQQELLRIFSDCLKEQVILHTMIQSML